MPSSVKNPPVLFNGQEEDENYASSEDSDFAPDDVGAGDDAVESANSDDEDEAGKTGKKRKEHADPANARDGDPDFENSGDEAVILKGKKKRRRKKKADEKNDAGGAGEDGEDGPLIKTRSMKAVEKAERSLKATSGPVTVDVNALWASMISAPILPSSKPPEDVAAQKTKDQEKENASARDKGNAKEEDTVTIKRTYNFAGRVHTETKVVARDSAEARLYLQSQGVSGHSPDGEADDPSSAPRKVRRAFRSAFEPLSLVQQQGAGGREDLNLGMANLLRLRDEAAKGEAKKLNTVQKSKMDWAGYVDKEGIRDELEAAGRKKGNFGDTQEFLARVDLRKDDEQRKVRMAGKT